MGKKFRLGFLIVLGLGLLAALTWYVQGHSLAVLSPKGVVAEKQRSLILLSTALMLLIVIPVFVLTFFIAWRYREGNTKARYTPDWDHNVVAESIWWGFPCLIILVLSIIAWNSSHSLEPSRALASNKKPLTIQVVALQWKWLFIYPDQNIATINYLHIQNKLLFDSR